MAEQNDTGEFSSGEATTSPSVAPPKQVRYRVFSMVRRVQTRTARATSPTRHRFKQYLFQGTDSHTRRLVRSRPIEISAEDLEKNLAELREKWKGGILEVRTMDGRVLNLEDFSVGPSRLPAPLPHPPLDSANNDTPAGYPLPGQPGGVSQMDPAADRIARELAEKKAKEAEFSGASPVTESEGAFGDPALEREGEEVDGGEDEQESDEEHSGEGTEDEGSNEPVAEGQSQGQVTSGKRKKKKGR
jgi:hypothetical protein